MIEVDADDTRVLYILFLVNVDSRRHKEEKLLKMWAYFSKARHCHLTGEYENAYSKLTTSPNAEGLKTNHHNKLMFKIQAVVTSSNTPYP